MSYQVRDADNLVTIAIRHWRQTYFFNSTEHDQHAYRSRMRTMIHDPTTNKKVMLVFISCLFLSAAVVRIWEIEKRLGCLMIGFLGVSGYHGKVERTCARNFGSQLKETPHVYGSVLDKGAFRWMAVNTALVRKGLAEGRDTQVDLAHNRISVSALYIGLVARLTRGMYIRYPSASSLCNSKLTYW